MEERASYFYPPPTEFGHAFKIQKIESYEDTLNNLQLIRTEEQESMLNSFSLENRDEYLIHYLLEEETKASSLSIIDFNQPFEYLLKISDTTAGSKISRKVDLVETFNYLMGIEVETHCSSLDKGYLYISGTLPNRSRTLIVWRDCAKIDDKALQLLLEEIGTNKEAKDKAYESIYINGDFAIPALTFGNEKTAGVQIKIFQIEHAFLERMFE